MLCKLLYTGFGTLRETYRFFIFSFADSQPRHLLLLLSSSSLPFQLINFLFQRLSPLSAAWLPSYISSHVLPSPSLHSACYSHQVPIFMISLSHFPASLKSIVFLPAMLVSWKNVFPYISLTFLLYSSFIPSCTSYLFISSAHEVIVMYVSAPHQELFLSPFSPSLPLLSRCSGLRSECPAIWVGEQHRAEYPGNDQWAVSQILGDYQCTEWDHKPDGVWWEFELNELCVTVHGFLFISLLFFFFLRVCSHMHLHACFLAPV